MQREEIHLEEMDNFAATFFEKIKERQNVPTSLKATIIALHGNLGAGKTTFTQALARGLGIQDHITSPTFVILKKYSIPISSNQNAIQTNFKTLIHIDAYRLKNGEELTRLGFDEILNNPENLICLEWPENVSDVLPDDIIKINLETVDENTRKISYEI